jgi:hypothetical protein
LLNAKNDMKAKKFTHFAKKTAEIWVMSFGQGKTLCFKLLLYYARQLQLSSVYSMVNSPEVRQLIKINMCCA